MWPSSPPITRRRPSRRRALGARAQRGCAPLGVPVARRGTPQGYHCRDLAQTLGTLVQRPDDGHALNCFGEYLRSRDPHIDLWQDREMIWGLAQDERPTFPSRLALYQAVMANPKAEPEDKELCPLSRHPVLCPSGYNSCDSQGDPQTHPAGLVQHPQAALWQLGVGQIPQILLVSHEQPLNAPFWRCC